MFVTQLLVLGLAVQNCFARQKNGLHEEEKGEEMGSIMAPESMKSGFGNEGVSAKGSPEIHVYAQ